MQKSLDSLKQKATLLKREIYALYFAFKDRRTPWYAKGFSVLVLAYAFSPIDLIPDFVPVLGYLDDLILIPLGITLALKMIPPAVMADARKEAENQIREAKPLGWLGAAIILLIWASLLFLIYRLISKTALFQK